MIRSAVSVSVGAALRDDCVMQNSESSGIASRQKNELAMTDKLDSAKAPSKGATRDEKLLMRYKRALEGLTPGGSEFFDSPETCAEFVREHDASLMKVFVETKKRLNVVRQSTAKEIADLLDSQIGVTPMCDAGKLIREKYEVQP